MTTLEIIDKLHPDIIHTFLSTGKCSGIPDDVQLFLHQMQWGAEVYEQERNISKAAKTLQTRILAEQGIRLDVRTCQARIYSAISYFSMDCNVATKIWETDFANKYEDLALEATKYEDFRTAKACYDAARECRLRASEAADKENAWAPVFLISNEVTAELLGFTKRNLKEIAQKNNNGFYVNLIDSLPVEKEEKQRLLRDANIVDAEIIEEIPEDGE
jgi:hypothetical protein